MSKLKDTSIGLGAMPGSLPNVAHVRPSPPKYDTPKDNGGMSVGVTSGNFNPASLSRPPNNSGGGTQAVADEVSAEFGAPGTQIL